MKRLPIIKPVFAWASVWDDGAKDAICQVSFYKDSLQDNLRHIRVRVVPTHRRRKRK